MAIASVGNKGTGVAGATASTSVSMTLSCTAGNVLLVNVVSPTATHSSVTDTVSNTYVKIAESAGNSQTVSLWMSKLTSSLTLGSLTANFGSSISDKHIGAWEFSVASGYTLIESTTEQTNTNTTSGFGSLAFSGLGSVSRLWFRGCGKNANSTTAITATTNFTSAGWADRSRNNTAARLGRAEFRINTSTGETSNPTFAVAGNYATVFVALDEVQMVSGTVAKTLDATTSSASGSVTTSGSVAKTLADATSVASGSSVSGTAAQTLAATTSAASGSSVTGSVAK